MTLQTSWPHPVLWLGTECHDIPHFDFALGVPCNQYAIVGFGTHGQDRLVRAVRDIEVTCIDKISTSCYFTGEWTDKCKAQET